MEVVIKMSCTTEIYIQDVTKPTAVCRDTTVALDATGTATLDVTAINNGSSDNCLSPVLIRL